MKALSNYIVEAIKIGASASNISVHSYKPKSKKELEEIINNRISKDGYECDLNDIDVSLVDDMSWLFKFSEFNGDISSWDTSNVTNMEGMFHYCDFNGDISKWDVSNVENMEGMFAWSKFNKDISNWDVINVKNMSGMFFMSKFNQDISKWNIKEDCCVNQMFDNCSIKEEYKPKSLQKK